MISMKREAVYLYLLTPASPSSVHHFACLHVCLPGICVTGFQTQGRKYKIILRGACWPTSSLSFPFIFVFPFIAFHPFSPILSPPIYLFSSIFHLFITSSSVFHSRPSAFCPPRLLLILYSLPPLFSSSFYSIFPFLSININ